MMKFVIMCDTLCGKPTVVVSSEEQAKIWIADEAKRLEAEGNKVEFRNKMWIVVSGTRFTSYQVYEVPYQE